MQNNYKKSGVNISLANKLVNHISKITKKDVQKGGSSLNREIIGGFGSLFDISNLKIKEPVIVSCTDGVGTKIELANKYKKVHPTVNPITEIKVPYILPKRKPATRAKGVANPKSSIQITANKKNAVVNKNKF